MESPDRLLIVVMYIAIFMLYHEVTGHVPWLMAIILGVHTAWSIRKINGDNK